MRVTSRHRAAALAGALLAAGIAVPRARAADMDAAQAGRLEQQLRGWTADLLGPRAHVPDRPVRMTPEGDHFRLAVPLTELFASAGMQVQAEPITGIARPLDGGRWALDDIVFPSPLRATMTMPGQGASTITFTADEQTQHAMLDPSMATLSSWDTTLKGYATRNEGGRGTQTTRMEELTSHLAWQPAEGGRMNLLQDVQGSLLALNALIPDTGRVELAAERLHGTLHMDGVTPASVAPILHALLEIMPLAMAAAEQAAPPPPPAEKPGKADKKTRHVTREQKPRPPKLDDIKLTPEAKGAVRAALVAARDLTTGFGEEVTFDNVHVEAAGHGGRATRLALGMAADAPSGLLALRMTLALDGLDSPEIPPGVYRDYLPRHIALAPRFSGVAAGDVMDLLLLAVDSDGDDKQLDARADALMHKGPISFGFDELAIDLGPVVLTGTAAMRMVERDVYEGQAHLVMSGMDALMRQAGTTPELQQATPVLIMMKGLAQQDGDKLVWNVTYQGDKLLVNGNDLSQMLPK